MARENFEPGPVLAMSELSFMFSKTVNTASRKTATKHINLEFALFSLTLVVCQQKASKATDKSMFDSLKPQKTLKLFFSRIHVIAVDSPAHVWWGASCCGCRTTPGWIGASRQAASARWPPSDCRTSPHDCKPPGWGMGSPANTHTPWEITDYTTCRASLYVLNVTALRQEMLLEVYLQWLLLNC